MKVLGWLTSLWLSKITHKPELHRPPVAPSLACLKPWKPQERDYIVSLEKAEFSSLRCRGRSDHRRHRCCLREGRRGPTLSISRTRRWNKPLFCKLIWFYYGLCVCEHNWVYCLYWTELLSWSLLGRHFRTDWHRLHKPDLHVVLTKPGLSDARPCERPLDYDGCLGHHVNNLLAVLRTSSILLVCFVLLWRCTAFSVPYCPFSVCGDYLCCIIIKRS